MRIKQMDGSIYDSRANENLRATVAEQAATIDYLAMMADIDIPTEEHEREFKKLFWDYFIDYKRIKNL